MPPTNDDFDTHEWKSEFASNRSGRNSPNIFAKVRRKLLLTPPVRNARSPRLTDEELDALTGDLPYATNYTYAYSKIYDPSLPDHWEVPNLAGGLSSGTLAEQEHWSAASLSRQLLYILRFPLYLIVHVITYILEAFYHLIKLSTFTVWDYILYLIKIAKIRYATYQDNRRRTALIRNRQDPFSVKAANFIRWFFETIVYIVAAPFRLISMLWAKNGVEQYDYKSIKNQLENERASRMTTRSQTLGLSRRFQGLSQSPARSSTPAAAKTSTITKITTRVFASPLLGSGPADNHTTPVTTSTTTTTRTVRERSVTPRFRNSRGSRARTNGAIDYDSPEVEVDTPITAYGLRNRGMNHLDTPEPTFDIGNAMATSTPLSKDVFIPGYVHEEESYGKVKNFVNWIGYIIFFPFFAARHIWYIIFDHAKSAYMKISNYQPDAMEEIRVRDVGELAPSADGTLYLPWTTRVSNFFSSFFQYIKESHQIVFAMLYGVVQDTASYVGGLFRGLTDKKSSKFNMLQLLGLLLALLLALFLFGFLTSDNTAIRKEIRKQQSGSKSSDGSLPTVPFYVKAGNNVKHYLWMTKEYVGDLVFSGYNNVKPIVGRTFTAPKYAWELLASGCGAIGKMFGSGFGSLSSGIENGASNLWYFITGGFANANKTIGGALSGAGKSVGDGIAYAANTSKSTVNYVFSETYNAASSICGGVYNFFTSTLGGLYNFFTSTLGGLLKSSSGGLNTFVNFIKNTTYGIYDFFYNTFFVKTSKFIRDTYPKIFKSGWNLARWNYDFFVFGVKTVIEWAVFLVTYPFQLATRAWIKISQYAPEDPVQVMPIPQAITPTPDVEPIVEEPEEPEEAIDTLIKRNEIGEEELVIIPAPAPEPIPVPVPANEPVVIHQTHIVETVDKDAIIREVTEKLRAELSAQFHQELSTKFEQNYNSIIQKLKVENTNIQYDNNQLEAIIRQMIYEYDTDKTGKVDYALESSGGAVVSTRCSETYRSYTRLTKFWDIPMYFWDESPRIVIQRNSKSLFPGECWCFKDGRGYIAVELSHYIDVASVSYEHIGMEVAPEGDRTSAPKGVLVWAYKQIDDLNSRVLLGDYTYDLDGPPLQFFIAKHKPDFPVKFVELEITSNHGAPYTCLYRLRVHGKMVKM